MDANVCYYEVLEKRAFGSVQVDAGIPVFYNNQVVVVSGETGKTTQLPQYLLEHTVLRGDGSRTRIVVTQPRRISAISVAERVARERGQEMREDVGYQIPRCLRGSILFCTTGIVLHYGLSAEELKPFKFMPLEAYTSAHENIKQDFKERVEDCPGLSENSRQFLEALGIDHRPPPRFIATFVNHIAQTCKPGAISVFIPGIADMQSVVKELKSLDPEFYVTDPKAGAVVCLLHSSLFTWRQCTVFSPAPERKRKVVIATNIAETRRNDWCTKDVAGRFTALQNLKNILLS
ncbi:hypothetical protein Aperf_G00000098496 [Anoplocephala perfoliata]